MFFVINVYEWAGKVGGHGSDATMGCLSFTNLSSRVDPNFLTGSEVFCFLLFFFPTHFAQFAQRGWVTFRFTGQKCYHKVWEILPRLAMSSTWRANLSEVRGGTFLFFIRFSTSCMISIGAHLNAWGIPADVGCELNSEKLIGVP